MQSPHFRRHFRSLAPGFESLSFTLFRRSFLKERGRSRPTAVWFWFVLRASLSWLGASKWASGSRLGRSPTASRPQVLDGDAVRRMLFRAGRSKRLVLLSAWVARWSLASSVPVSRCGAGCGAAGHSFAAVCGMKRCAGTVGRDQSEGATSPGSGVMTCTIRSRPSLAAHAARGGRCRARMW
jgi:hypothetical protein